MHTFLLAPGKITKIFQLVGEVSVGDEEEDATPPADGVVVDVVVGEGMIPPPLTELKEEGTEAME